MENIVIHLSSGREAELREISAREQMNADDCSKGNPIKLGYYRTVMSLARLGDEVFSPATNDLTLEQRIDKLTGKEMDEIANVYADAYAPRGEVIKKGVSPT